MKSVNGVTAEQDPLKGNSPRSEFQPRPSAGSGEGNVPAAVQRRAESERVLLIECQEAAEGAGRERVEHVSATRVAVCPAIWQRQVRQVLTGNRFAAILFDASVLGARLSAERMREQVAALRRLVEPAALLILAEQSNHESHAALLDDLVDDVLPRRDLTPTLLHQLLRQIQERQAHQAAIRELHRTLDDRVADRTRTLSLLHDVAATANGIHDVEQAFARVLQLVCRSLQWCCGRVHVSSHQDGILIPSGIEYADDTQLLPRMAAGQVSPDALCHEASWLERAFRELQPTFVRNMHFHPREVVRQFALDMQFCGAAAVPVVVGKEVAAVLEFFAHGEIHNGPRLQETLGNVGIQLARVVERKQAERSVRESEERFRLLVSSVEDYAIFLLDTGGHVVSWNAGARRIKGYESREVLGRHVSCFYAPRDQAAGLPARHLELAAARGRWATETELVRAGGQRYWASSVITALRDEAGELRGFAKVTHDVTRRKELEKEIADRTSAEQQRIGQDLHDGLGQQLTGLAYEAERLRRKLRPLDPDLQERAARLLRGIQESIGQVRMITKGLMPVEVDAHGLRSALEELAEHTEDVGEVACGLRCDRPVPIEDNQTATQMFRIAQEAVTNALRHARPRLIELDLAADEDCIWLTIRDDGQGFRESSQVEGNGFRIMRHRAGLIRASLQVTSQPGRGTLVHCQVPRGAD